MKASTPFPPPPHIPDYRACAREHTRVVSQFFDTSHDRLVALTEHISTLLQRGNRLLICGNGGSACDAMHIAGEFVGRFKQERQALAAMALSADSGIITAIANDYHFTRIFARQVEGLGQQGDMLITLSTSGSSPNIVEAQDTAIARGMDTCLFTGLKGRERAEQLDFGFVIDSTDTAHIQECTMVALHAITEGVENRLLCA